MPLLRNSRFYILGFSFILAIVEYLIVISIIPPGSLQIIRLTQVYGITSVIYLYLATIIGPIFAVFPNLSYKNEFTHARKALGLSTFIFASLHGINAFFRQLGGIDGLGFLNTNFLIAISISFFAFLILALLSITSIDKIISILGFKNWKLLHRLVYLALILILVHMLMLGSHFQTFLTLIPLSSFILLSALLILESVRLDIQKNTKKFTFLAFTSVVVLFLLMATDIVNLNIHSRKHSPVVAKPTQMTMPELDYTKSYTVSKKSIPENIVTGSTTLFKFSVMDDQTHMPVLYFATPYQKPIHLYVVDEHFKNFAHLHPLPELNPSEYEQQITFPQQGKYYLYTDFQPLGSPEQVNKFEVSINEGPESILTSFKIPDPQGYQISVETNEQNSVTVKIYDSTGNPVTNLYPYLNSFAHLALINTKTYDLIHMHEIQMSPRAPDERGGPVVELKVMPNSSNIITPGTYQAFLELNPNNNLVTTKFSLEFK